MFREMRRSKQQLSNEECIAILEKGTSGVLAVEGDDGYPYAVPLSYVFWNGQIIFHCATSGHKLDALKRNEKASFCVIGQDDVVPEKFTTAYRSVIVFGRAQLLDDANAKRLALELLTQRYAPAHKQEGMKRIEEALGHVCMVAIHIEHMTGKEGLELLNMRNANAEG